MAEFLSRCPIIIVCECKVSPTVHCDVDNKLSFILNVRVAQITEL